MLAIQTSIVKLVNLPALCNKVWCHLVQQAFAVQEVNKSPAMHWHILLMLPQPLFRNFTQPGTAQLELLDSVFAPPLLEATVAFVSIVPA